MWEKEMGVQGEGNVGRNEARRERVGGGNGEGMDASKVGKDARKEGKELAGTERARGQYQ